MSSMYVINSRGDKELFSEQKLYNSVKRTALSDQLAEEIFDSVKKEIYPDIKTSEIFRKIKKKLSRKSKAGAARFNLKEGMRKLGPTGFPFERFAAEVLRSIGFDVKIGQHIPGRCLKDYEIDFIARKKGLVYVGECKYRNLSGDRVHQQDALANYARFQDILAGPYFKSGQYDNCAIKTILITNTKFTGNAFDYSSCVGVDLLGWRTPRNEGLEYLIEKHKLYPVTLLHSLKGYLKDILVSEELSLISDVAKINPEKFSAKFRVPAGHIRSLVEEARDLTEKFEA